MEASGEVDRVYGARMGGGGDGRAKTVGERCVAEKVRLKMNASIPLDFVRSRREDRHQSRRLQSRTVFWTRHLEAI